MEQRSFEASLENRISEEHFNRRLHPLVHATKKILEGKAGQQLDQQVPLDIRVSKRVRARALRFLSALFYAFEERGFSVKAMPREEKGSVVIIKGEPLRFSLEEPSKKVIVPASKKTSPYARDFEFEPTGRLIFRIHDCWAQGLRKNWADGVKHSLEEQLNDIIPVLVDISLIAREKRAEREQQWAFTVEQSRLRVLDETRRKQLDADLRSWQESARLREFIARVQICLLEDEQKQPERLRWTQWAIRTAGRLDPLDEGLEAFLARYIF